MKKILLSFVVTSIFISANAQEVPTKALKKGISITMPRTVDEDMPGTRGACVAWNPLQKKYYASMAGNMGFPMGVYDALGKRISSDTLNCNADTRGLWYNPVKKELQGNTYNENGWFSYAVNLKGIPVKTTIFLEGKNQPADNSVGAFNPVKQQVLFLDGNEVFSYTMKGITSDQPLEIHWGLTKGSDLPEDDEAFTSDDYNSTTVVYTGIKGAELGFLNTTNSQIELYNIADGYLTRKLTLPDDAAVNSTFNFAYTNGMFWLFNMEERIWTAYK